MQYVHVRKLEEYHPGYRDRELQWCKAYFKMLNADPDFEMLDEIDRWRFLAFVMLELQIKKPIPLNEDYLRRKGFDIKKRPISATLKMLHNSIEVVTQQDKSVWPIVDKDKDKDKDKELGVTKKRRNGQLLDDEFLKALKKNPAYTGVDIDRELSRMDAWLLTRPGRAKTRRFVVNWLNRSDRPILKTPPCRETTERDRQKRLEEAEKMRKERQAFDAYSDTDEYKDEMRKHKETMKALSEKMGIKK